jgi:hypothetical protein
MRKLSINLTMVLFLAGCASVEVDKSITTFDETKYAADLDTCRGGHLLAATFETVKYSAVGGALGAVHGIGAAAYSDSIEAIIIGAAAGGVLGAGAGIYQGVKDRQTEISGCLRGKGYTIAPKES